jgi:osmotically inducible lipoprotein OsmB
MRAIKKPYIPATLFAAALSLSGCVTSDLERAGIGAAAGGLTAAAFDGNIGTGIIIGAAGGALCDDAGLC